jgi:uncharacterized protein YqjF (DUF2071 family)
MPTRWRRTLEHTEHRPYPAPTRPWVLRMAWRELLFAHWSLAPSTVRPLLPPTLELDEREGRAWIGIVPFRMADTAPRGLPALPGGPSNFLELNVRTYVRHEGRPGVWFFSLDANSRIAVRIARATFRLPYHDARMSLRRDPSSGWIDYASERTHRGVEQGAFRGSYRGTGPLPPSAPGSLEHWLTERYFLASVGGDGRPMLGEIHHPQWPLQQAEARIEACTVARAFGIELPDEPPILHYAEAIDVVAWPLRSV